ncbi:T9SS type A sorting domain-containing protein [Winogradskyella sp.]|uniref:T9SS type A sorting domain-containing protein n=1 Tax=Winogradskyella sp. TaxID=1883156 RepID=UPI0025FAAE6B|nr:T9SS type A sorting domain-containing protein [Winogradskyella sp.]
MKRFLLSMLLCITCTIAFAQTTWTGLGANTNWNNIDNWDTNLVPTAADNVIIPTASIATINVAASVLSIDIQGTAMVTISSSLTFVNPSAVGANAVINWTFGSINGGGSTFTNNGTFNLTGASSKTITGLTTFNNEGTFNITSSGDFLITDGIFNNQLAGIMDMQADSGNITYSGSAPSRILNNYGLLKKTTSSGVAFIQCILNNFDGIIEVESGTLTFNFLTKALTDGTYNVAVGTVLNWDVPMNVSGSLTGTLDGILDWSTTLIAATTLSFDFSGANGLQWTSGTITGGGTVTNNNILDLISTSGHSIQGLTTFNNESTVNITSSGDLLISDGIFNNQLNATIDMQADAGNITYSGSATRILNNYGLIKRTTTSGNAQIQCFLNNFDGNIDIQSGSVTFNFQPKTLIDGNYDIASGSVLNWDTGIDITGSLTGVLDGVLDWSAIVTASTTASFDFSGPNGLQWNNGILTGGGTVTNNGILDLISTSSHTINGLTTFNNEGEVNITDTGDLLISDGVFNNQLNSTIDMQADAGNITYSGSASRILNNYGLIKRTTTTGNADIQCFLNNFDGTINIESGSITFNFQEKTLTDGEYNIAAGSNLNWGVNTVFTGTIAGLVDGDINWNSTVTIPAATTVNFDFSGTGSLNWRSSSLLGGGTLVLKSPINLTTTGSKTITGLTTLNNESGFNIISSGDLLISDGVLNNQLTGVIDLQADGGNIAYAGSASRILNNYGTIKRTTTAGSVQILVFLNNFDGNINVESGTLIFNFQDKTLTNGNYNVAAGAVLEWDININPIGTLEGLVDGDINWDSTVTVPTATTANFDFSGTGSLNWRSSSLLGGGTLVAMSPINLTTTSTKTINELTTLNNESDLNFIGTGNLLITDGILNNQASGVMDLQVDNANISYSGSASRILNNFGLLKKSGGAGVTSILVQTTNSGIIDVMTGELEFVDPLGINNTATGIVKGVGTIDIPIPANHTNDGTFAPGASPGTLSVIGNFISSTSSVLDVELDGLTPDTEHDVLAITGTNVVFEGNVNISMGFEAEIGNTFTIATTTGTITTQNLVTPIIVDYDGKRYTFDVTYPGNNSVVLSISDKLDIQVPDVITQDITVQLDINGNASITTGDIDNGSSDNCTLTPNLVFALDTTSFTCSNLGTNTVNLTVTDEANNFASLPATVTVEDNVAPTVVTQNIIVQLDNFGNASIIPGDVDNGSSDACGIDTLDLDVFDFTCANIGVNIVTLTVIDNEGNSSNDTAMVTVEDDLPPSIVTQDITVQLDGTGNVSIVPGDVDNGSSDNCGIASMSLDVSDFTCVNIGPNAVNLSILDGEGNFTNDTVTVTVEDIEEPTVVAQNVTVQLDASGNASITTADINNGSSDNCTIASLSLDVTAFTCSDLGDRTVELTVTDQSGNTAMEFATVTVIDVIAPTITCPSGFNVESNGDYTLPDYFLDNEVTATDNCNITVVQTPVPGTVLPDGDYTISFTATDASGNSDACSFDLKVIDTTLSLDDFELSSDDVLLFPNPVSDIFTIQNNSRFQLINVEIFDVTGKRIQFIDLRTMPLEKEVSLANYATGVYVIRIYAENNSTLVKRIVKK